jgi:exopolysaccharide production protein ExoZ
MSLVGVNRLNSLDYLRGISAFGIMIYHYSSWTFGRYKAETFMGRVGIYGVAIFYVLSGLTLFHVYHHKMKPTLMETKSFFKKRFFRIFPLLWIVTIIAILLSNKDPNFFHLFLNLTGLFGFFAWDVTFSAGVWSIGNELVFYTCFPVFIYFSKKQNLIFWLLGAIIFLIFIYFAFVRLPHNASPGLETRNYFNPLNNLFLFFAGFSIGKILHNKSFKKELSVSFILLGLAVFIFYPATGNRIELLIGINRLVFSFSCFLICSGFYKMNYILPEIIHKPFIFLGEISYSMYLVHALVFKLINLILIQLIHSPLSIILMSVCFTIFFSYFIYNYFEKFFMNLGRK